MPSRSFDPVKTEVLSVLTNHLSVPKYQRPYTWKTENIDLLWEDLWAQDGHVFLGIIVLHDNGGVDPNGTKRVEVIDGQQRITTITVMLALVRNLAADGISENLAIETQRAIERSNAMGSEGYVLWGANSLALFLQENIQASNPMKHEYLLNRPLQGLSSEEEKIVRNYRRTYELITQHKAWAGDIDSKIDMLKKFKSKILESELIQVTVNSEDDAYDLFETLNSRSVSLSEVNMIKNRIFMTLSSEYKDDELEKKWATIEENAGGLKKKPEEIQKFINYFWWSRYAKVSPKQIFRELRKGDIGHMLSEFVSDSEVYEKVKSQDSSRLIQFRHINLTEICNLAQLLNLNQVYIPILSLARKFSLEDDKYWNDFSNKTVEPFILKLEKFIFAYKFSPRSPAKLERLYSKWAIAIYKSKNRTEFVNTLLAFEADLNENFPTEEEFKQSISKLRYIPGSGSSNKIISYALSKIYFGDNKEVVVNEADIEHIFPQNPPEGFRAEEIDLKDSLHSLGNLTLLSEEINRQQCKNSRPQDKSHFYAASNIIVNHSIGDDIQKNGWDVDKINSRTEILIGRIWEYVKP